ncbi:MAG: sodium:solute symporter [Myxococcales bacterium]|nr:sodium:solute symporter [Myxococcales bacterium]
MPATLAPIDIAIILGFLIAVTLIGVVLSRAASKGIDDYFLGGNKIPWWVLGISTATSNFDMSGTMLIVAVVFGLGYKGLLVELRGGVGLTLALLLVFLGKWLRRSRVMTSAEWMKLRFGTGRQGRAAHLLSAIANILLSVGMIAYFSKGAGKFLTHFLPFGEVTCTAVMVAVGLAYTLMSGLYGVVFTDVIQMILLTFTAIFVTIHAYDIAPTVELPAFLRTLDLAPVTGDAGAALLAQSPSWAPVFDFFALCVAMWFIRSILEGMGGVGGYTDQRFFAARTEREASLLTLESILLSVFRWTLVAGLVVMGYALIAEGGAHAEVIARDPEQVLPLVLGHLLPDGVRGLVLAGLIAAAMSTFDSTLNAGASYIVKDIYQTYIDPEATPARLMKASHWSTFALCVVGVAFAAVIPDINRIWGWLTMGLGAGLFIPLVLRWYWPRFNGYGFAIGTAGGIIAGVTFNGLLGWPVYAAFPLTLATALAACLAGAAMAPATDDRVLLNFVAQINPGGLWRRHRRRAIDAGLLTPELAARRRRERRRDLIAIAFALPFQVCLLLAGMAFVWHDFDKLGALLAVVGVTGVGLYVFWYRNLKPDAIATAEDEAFADPIERVRALTGEGKA